MSVETDTMHYYREIDRQQAWDAAFESAQKDALDELYAEIEKLCGEPWAEAVTSHMPYSGDELLVMLADARKHVNERIDSRANDKMRD